MRIEAIKIGSEHAASEGLKEINLSKLGQIVLIAGRNGSGKSRLLNILLFEAKRLKQLRDRSDNMREQIESAEAMLTTLAPTIADLARGIENAQNGYDARSARTNLSVYEKARADNLNVLDRNKQDLLQADRITLIGEGAFLPYVPKNTTLHDPNLFNKTHLRQNASSVKENGLQNFNTGTLAAIQVAQDRYFSVRHPDSQASVEEREQAIASYERLSGYIEQLLSTKLKRDIDDNALIFGRQLGDAKLSDGQTILLQFCVALHAQAASLPDLVLLLDEPENHLHPAALIEVLDRLQAAVTRGQIWIATHSVNVLAHFDNPTIYYMEDGALSYAGDIPEKVLAGLLGDEEEREKLANFLALPFEMSSTRFAYESLLLPAVVMTDGKDPQLQQIQEALRQVRDAQGRVRVLDFGAGRGRLIATIEDMEPTGAEQPAVWLDYVAYDPYPTNAVECQANIERVYGPVSDRYFSDLGPLRTRYHDSSFDIVLLTNVFHEISPKEWGKTMRDIAQLLKPEGFLLIVEDQRLPHGERAHEYGFLLFDTLEFRQLFTITEDDETHGLYLVQAERGGRLKAHYFKRELLGRMSVATKLLALKELEENAKREINRIRLLPERSFKNGKLHALWMNQFANAQLAIEELE